jgi:DNA-binding HxlR family transcriptional regulator
MTEDSHIAKLYNASGVIHFETRYVLQKLIEDGDLRFNELSDENTSRATLSKRLRAAEKYGLVERKPKMPPHGAAYYVYSATALGRKMLKQFINLEKVVK